MKTEEEIMERMYYADKQADEMYKYGNWADMAHWYSYVDALRWVLEERE